MTRLETKKLTPAEYQRAKADGSLVKAWNQRYGGA